MTNEKSEGKQGGAERRSGVTGPSLFVLAAVALGAALYFMRPVLVPLVLAVLLSYLITPVVDFIQVRLKVHRAIGVVAALLLAGALLTAVGLLISSSAARLAGKAGLYQEKLVEMGNDALALAQRIGIPVDAGVVRAQLGELPVAGMLAGTLNSVVDSFSTFFLVLLFVIYLVAGRGPGEQGRGVYREIDLKIRKYIAIKVAVSGLTGILVGLLLWIIGLDLAAVFGVLAFLLNFIPSVGSVIATLLPLPLAIVQFDSTAAILAVLLLPGVVQTVAGNVMEPRMMGTSLNLHPITILLSLIFWGMLWGIAGMVLAAPITAVIKIILDRFDGTRPVGDLLAGVLPQG
jgi:AI-2 transport protein TqsA